MNTPNANIPYRLCTALLAVLCIQDVSARCGSVDYSWGADGLAEATAFVGTMMIYTVEILYAVAGIVVIVAALQIGIKMNYHEGDITKSMMMLLVSSVLFASRLIQAVILGEEGIGVGRRVVNLGRGE